MTGGGAGRPQERGRPGLRAVLFDMDGLLVDSEPVWTIAEREVAERFDREFTPAVKAAMVGRGVATAVPIMLEMLGVTDADPDKVGQWLVERTAELFREPGRLTTMPGAVSLLDALARLGVPAGLVSSSYRPLMDAVLDLVGPDRFAVTVAGDEVERAKPYPDPYLAAIGRLGMPAASCLVLEDSPAGARAGIDAGCPTVLVPSMPVAEPPPPGAVVIDTLDGVTVADLAIRAGLAPPNI